MASCVIKQFEMEERSTENMDYEIIIYFRGKEAERFREKTQREAWNKLEAAGYKRVMNHAGVILVT